MGTVPSSLQRSLTINDTPVRLPSEIVARVEFQNITGKIVSITKYDNGIAGAAYPAPNNSGYIVEGLENTDQVEVYNGTDGDSINLSYTIFGS